MTNHENVRGSGGIDLPTHSQPRHTSLYSQGQFLRYPVDKTLCRLHSWSGRDGQRRKILSLMGIKLHRQELSPVFHNQGSAEHRSGLRQKSWNTYIKTFKRNSKSLSKYCRKCPEIGNSEVIFLSYQLPLRFLACKTFS